MVYVGECKFIPEACDALLENLKLKVDACLFQKGGQPPVYGNEIGKDLLATFAQDKRIRRKEKLKNVNTAEESSASILLEQP